jgi:hypothetical protein
MLTDTQVALLSSLWQGMATFYGIIFVVYTVQLNYWLGKERDERLDSAGRYNKAFVAIIFIGLFTLGAIIVCLWGLVADDERIVLAAAVYSAACIVGMFGFLVYEVFTSAAMSGLSAWVGDVRSNDPERKKRALRRTYSIDPKTGKKMRVNGEMKIVFEGEEGEEPEEWDFSGKGEPPA